MWDKNKNQSSIRCLQQKDSNGREICKLITTIISLYLSLYQTITKEADKMLIQLEKIMIKTEGKINTNTRVTISRSEGIRSRSEGIRSR